MTKRTLPTPEDLRKLLRYDPETGKLWWRDIGSRRWNHKPAFTTDNGHGYMRGSIRGIQCVAHRVIWALHYGEWPDGFIDHINGDKADNRIANLREASKSENMCNRGVQANCTSGMKGAYFNKRQKSWYSRIMVNGEDKFLGYFETKELAHAAYCEAALILHGEFARGE